MDELSSKKNLKQVEGPSELTIKRIMAFSRALKKTEKNPKEASKGEASD